jgi:hypothetical protein
MAAIVNAQCPANYQCSAGYRLTQYAPRPALAANQYYLVCSTGTYMTNFYERFENPYRFNKIGAVILECGLADATWKPCSLTTQTAEGTPSSQFSVLSEFNDYYNMLSPYEGVQFVFGSQIAFFNYMLDSSIPIQINPGPGYPGMMNPSMCNQGEVMVGITGEFSAPGSYLSTLQPVCSTLCDICEAGKYSSAPGSLECKTCPAGTIAPTAGMTECLSCALGTYSAAGAVACSNCNDVVLSCTTPMMKVCYPGSGPQCLICSPQIPTNAKLVHPGLTCDWACNIGNGADALGATCVLCVAGSYAPAGGQGACTACAQGSFSTGNGLLACTQCSSVSVSTGQYLSGCGGTSPGQAARCFNGA